MAEKQQPTAEQQALNFIVRLALEKVNAMKRGSASQEAVAAALNASHQMVTKVLSEANNGDATT